MKLKSEAHDSLSMLFKGDGVPPKIVVDDSKEKYLGKYSRKCCEANCHLVDTDPYRLWMIATKECCWETTGGLQAWAPTASATQKQIMTSSWTPP